MKVAGLTEKHPLLRFSNTTSDGKSVLLGDIFRFEEAWGEPAVLESNEIDRVVDSMNVMRF